MGRTPDSEPLADALQSACLSADLRSAPDGFASSSGPRSSSPGRQYCAPQSLSFVPRVSSSQASAVPAFCPVNHSFPPSLLTVPSWAPEPGPRACSASTPRIHFQDKESDVSRPRFFLSAVAHASSPQPCEEDDGVQFFLACDDYSAPSLPPLRQGPAAAAPESRAACLSSQPSFSVPFHSSSASTESGPSAGPGPTGNSAHAPPAVLGTFAHPPASGGSDPTQVSVRCTGGGPSRFPAGGETHRNDGQVFPPGQSQSEAGAVSSFPFEASGAHTVSADPPGFASLPSQLRRPPQTQGPPFSSPGPTFVLAAGPEGKQWKGLEGLPFRPEDGKHIAFSLHAETKQVGSCPALGPGPSVRSDAPQLDQSAPQVAPPQALTSAAGGLLSASRPEPSQPASFEKALADDAGLRPPFSAVPSNSIPSPSTSLPSPAASLSSVQDLPHQSSPEGASVLSRASSGVSGPLGPAAGAIASRTTSSAAVLPPAAAGVAEPAPGVCSAGAPKPAAAPLKGLVSAPRPSAPAGRAHVLKSVGGMHGGKRGPFGTPGLGGLQSGAAVGAARAGPSGAHAERAGVSGENAIFRKAHRTPAEAIVAHAVSAAAAVERQGLGWPALGLFSPGAARGVEKAERDDEDRKACVAAFETELPPMEWLPSISHLLHVFDYISPPILQKCLGEEEASLAGKPHGEDSVTAAKPATSRPDEAAPLPPAGVLSQSKSKGTPEKPEGPAVPAVVSACGSLPPAFPPPVSALLGPPPPPTGGLGRGPFPPASTLAPSALLAGAVDPGSLFSKSRPRGLASKRPHIHTLLHPRGWRHRGLERDDAVRGRGLLPAKAFPATSACANEPDPPASHGRGNPQTGENPRGTHPGEAPFQRSIVPPDRRLTVVSLDLKRACGAALFDLLRQILERDADIEPVEKGEQAEKTQQGAGAPTTPDTEAAQKSERGEKGSQSNFAGPEGEAENGEGRPAGEAGDASTRLGPGRPERPAAAGLAGDARANACAGKGRAFLPPPEEMLWNLADWHEAVDALCVAWLADASLPPVLSLPQIPAFSPSPSFLSSLPNSLSPYLLRQPVSCLSNRRRRADASLSGTRAGDCARAESGPVSEAGSPRPEEEGSQTEGTVGAVTGVQAQRETGGEKEAEMKKENEGERKGGNEDERKEDGVDELGDFHWVLSLADLLAADVRRQLATAAEREIDFACLVQMADTLQREEVEQKQLVGLPLEPVARNADAGDDRAPRRKYLGSEGSAGRGGSTPSACGTGPTETRLFHPSSLSAGASASPSLCLSSVSSPASGASGSSYSPSNDDPAAAGAAAALAAPQLSPSSQLGTHAKGPFLGASSGRSLASFAAPSASLAALLSAFACILEVDVQDAESQTRIDDRFHWDLRHGDSAVLAYCQQLGVDFALPPRLVALYRVAFHRGVERRKRDLVSEYKPELKRFHCARGLAPPLGTVAKTRAPMREQRFGGGQLFYRPNRTLFDEGGIAGLSGSLLLPWSSSIVSFRRTQPSIRRPLFLYPPASSACTLFSLLPHTALERLPSPFLAGAPPSLSSDSPFLGRGPRAEDGAAGSGDSKRVSLSQEADKEQRRSLLFDRDGERLSDSSAHAHDVADFGPLVFRGPSAASWPGRRAGHKRRRR
ncbi:hypothetical protein TGVEG_226350 [Toxoplasma gondii VEG]|uniref:Uncharacterized protein n=2 Tax=Toxoplasma gondii TaxID=5811 RepID=V5BAX7_TOXGV|nr:hypothetical protein TGVEG_226350 [Toxoplasma gondii VEG]CEL76496.1 TPA: hypothetical protein BN1205_067340 [Toxoplasma gondii VEG]